MSDTVGSLRPSSFPSFELNRFHAEIGGRPTSNWPSKKKEKERVKLKKTPDLVFKGFGDDDDPFGDSKAEISEDELESRKKKRGKINVEYDMGKVEGFLNNELDQLKGKLGELRLGRPTVKSFNSVLVDLPASQQAPNGEKVHLSEISQIAIKSASVIDITLFHSEHAKRVTTALRAANKQWQPIDKGNGSICIELPKTTKETRDKLIAKAKEFQQEYTAGITEIENNAKIDIKDKITVRDWGIREVKELQKLTKPYHQVSRIKENQPKESHSQDGKSLVRQKIEELSLE